MTVFQNEIQKLFSEAVQQYLKNVRTLLETDVKVPSYYGQIFNTRNNLQAATFASRSFTEYEIEYFYEVYDRLWLLGGKLEAYTLMRLVFGVLSKKSIEFLYRQGHLFSTREVYNYANKGSGGGA